MISRIPIFPGDTILLDVPAHVRMPLRRMHSRQDSSEGRGTSSMTLARLLSLACVSMG